MHAAGQVLLGRNPNRYSCQLVAFKRKAWKKPALEILHVGSIWGPNYEMDVSILCWNNKIRSWAWEKFQCTSTFLLRHKFTVNREADISHVMLLLTNLFIYLHGYNYFSSYFSFFLQIEGVVSLSLNWLLDFLRFQICLKWLIFLG